MNKPKVYFIGAGPGDPELLTIKGKKLIDSADLIIYTGSLVNKALFSEIKSECILINSAELTLDEIIQIVIDNVQNGLQVIRVHTGDPSIFGAIQEQINRLEKQDIEIEIVPGVSSFSAAAGRLKQELTVPEITQTVILTRAEGKTPVSKLENLADLAAHKSTIVLFLSIGLVKKVQTELLKHYPEDTPVAIVYHATWPDEQIYITELKDLVKTVYTHNITKTALILVGNFLKTNLKTSKLYDKNFSHGFRTADT